MAQDNVGGGSDGGYRSVVQNGVQGIWALVNLFTRSALFGPTSLTVGVSTAAGLPANPTQGDRRMVTDATSTTFNAPVAGGGANVVPVFFDGTIWRIG